MQAGSIIVVACMCVVDAATGSAVVSHQQWWPGAAERCVTAADACLCAAIRLAHEIGNMRPQLFLLLLLAISAPAARVLGERLVFHSDKARPGDPPRGSGVHAGLPGAAPGLHFKEQQQKAIENDEKAEKLQKGGIHSWLPGWLGGHPREFRFWPAHDDTPIYPHVGAKPTSTAGQRQGEASKASGHRDHPDTPVRFSSLFSIQQQPAKPRAWREAIADWYEGIELSARFGWYVGST